MAAAQKDISFSIIMPTYNRKHYISNAIESLLAQKYNRYELIIIRGNKRMPANCDSVILSGNYAKQYFAEFPEKTNMLYKGIKDTGPSRVNTPVDPGNLCFYVIGTAEPGKSQAAFAEAVLSIDARLQERSKDQNLP
jgi:cellulose synthase/poly-beta-1,6-N-acetylglucosamine synthase-like glycosyltransferase